MKTNRNRWMLTVLVLALAALVTFQAQGRDQRRDSLQEEMRHAAAKAGIEIQTEEMFTMSRENVTFVGAVVDGFENVGANTLPEGVDFGFAYIDMPSNDVPAGYYTLRVTADDPQLGETQGTVALVDQKGRTVSTLDSVIDVRSMEVPDEPLAPRTVVGGSLDTDEEFQRIIVSGWYICPNGMMVCFTLVTDDWFWFW